LPFSRSPRLVSNQKFQEKRVYIEKCPSLSLFGQYASFLCASTRSTVTSRSTVVKPGQAVSVIPQSDLVITNAALGTELADSTGRTSVKLTYMRPVKVTSDDEDEEKEDDDDDDEPAQVETVLCSFTPGKVLYMYHWRIDSRD